MGNTIIYAFNLFTSRLFKNHLTNNTVNLLFVVWCLATSVIKVDNTIEDMLCTFINSINNWCKNHTTCNLNQFVPVRLNWYGWGERGGGVLIKEQPPPVLAVAETHAFYHYKVNVFFWWAYTTACVLIVKCSVYFKFNCNASLAEFPRYHSYDYSVSVLKATILIVTRWMINRRLIGW